MERTRKVQKESGVVLKKTQKKIKQQAETEEIGYGREKRL